MAKCFFSVVIPLYNMADTIRHTINTVLHQTFQDFEIIVVDDGSKDNGAVVAKTIGDERITIIQQPNKGVSAARNNGIEHANGQFITFLDADDEYAPTHLETLKNLTDTYPDHNVYATSYLLFKDGKTIIPSIKNLHFKKTLNPNDGIIESYFHTVSSKHIPVHVCTIAIRRTKLGNIRFPVGVKSSEDLYFIARLMINNEMVLSLKPTFIYNYVEISRTDFSHEKIDDYFDSLLKLDCKDKYLRHYVALWNSRRAANAMRGKYYKNMFYRIKRSLQIRPFQTKIFTVMLSALFHR